MRSGVLGRNPIVANLALDIGRDAARKLEGELGPTLSYRDRLQVVRAFRQVLLPARPPGRKRSERITAAYQDWKHGIRGLALYNAHIKDYSKLSEWRRKGEVRRLMEAIRSRDRRTKPKTGNAMPCG